MRVRVTRAFDGVVDGAIHPRRIEEDEIITGDLARVALDQQWGEELAEGDEAEDVDKLTRTGLEKLAGERGIDISAAKTKAEILAIVKAA